MQQHALAGSRRQCAASSSTAPARAHGRVRAPVVALAKPNNTTTTAPPPAKKTAKKNEQNGFGMGDLLGPIGLTISASVQEQEDVHNHKQGVELGPIALSFGSDLQREAMDNNTTGGDLGASLRAGIPSIHSMTTAEWRALYEKDGTVDLWMEDEFNAGSRLIGGRAVHKGGIAGFRSGEGVSAGDAPVHKVKIFNHYQNAEFELEVPEDRYILFEAEDKGLQLPYACRMGCCTACAVKVVEGSVYQPEAMGISRELKEQGYALMCVGFPSSDAVLQTVSEDEIYDLQFGESFQTQALDPNNPDYVQRDDFAIELALGDE